MELTLYPKLITDALTTVTYPGTKKNLIDSNMLADDVRIDGMKVKFTLIFPRDTDPFLKSTLKAAEAAIHYHVSKDVEVTIETEFASKPRPEVGKMLPQVKNVIAVSSGKGGVGKSTVAANLAIALVRLGYKVGLLDADIFGPSMPKMFDVESERPYGVKKDGRDLIEPIEKYGVKLLSIGFFVNPETATLWRGGMASNALKQLIADADWGELDYFILDTPPGTSDIHLTLLQTLAITGAVIVSTPQSVALADARKGIDMYENDKVNVPILGLVENMAWFTPAELPENKYYIFGKEGCKNLAKEMNVPLLAQIPLVKSICENGDKGTPAALDSDSITWIRSFGGQQELAFDDRKGKEVEETERFLGNIDNVLINGTQLLLDQVYDGIGFNQIPDEILRHLVIARVSQPKSKLATVEYLKSYYDEDVDLNHIYRYMDKLYNTQMELAQQISVEHTKKLFGGKIGLMFYDVTTLYFETAQTDVLREPGFSKDGKTAESQVVLGLLVSEGGYPLSYSLFNGSQYEGFTMIPMIDDFKQRFTLGDDFVVVADSGLMNKNNVTLLQEAGYKYILGARIKSESASVKQWILSLDKIDKACYDYKRENGERLVVSYSEKRAKKDAYNRDRGIARLRKAYKSGRITKNQVNKRGYNKFLEISKDIEVVISEEKIAEDCKWDGLKGYITNTDLDAERVIAEYHGLWVVERAFRISKGTLEMRPMFHFTERRIEAHVCICFIAYKIYKELERLIAINKKVVYMPNPVRARYIKLLIPRTTTSINNVDSPELFAFHIYGTEADTDGIQNINYNRDVDCPKAVYDLQGRRIHDNSYRGVRIEDGRLVVGQ